MTQQSTPKSSLNDTTPEQEIEKLKTAIQTVLKIQKQQVQKILELEQIVTDLRAGNATKDALPGGRKLRADPINITLALWMRHAKNMTVRQIADTGVLSYSQTASVVQWSFDDAQAYIKSIGMDDIYKAGDTIPDFENYAPNYNES